jgi:Domain of unknown function (DUF1707)
MAMPGDPQAPVAAGRGHLRASHADRDQMVDTLKAAFVEGRLTMDEFDARVGQALASRTYGELAAVAAGIPAAARAPARPPRTPPAPAQPHTPSRRPAGHAARWGKSGLVTPAILAAGFTFGALPGEGRYGAVAFVVAFVYFVFWLSAGADMLWQWFSMGLPTARMCVRCAHTAASHRAPASCTVRLSPLNLWGHCSCAGYVPPGLSPEAADLR